MSTKAEQTYERINALVSGGTKKADAFKQLAEEYGQPVDSVRGAYYSVHRASPGTPRRARKRETTTQDAVLEAVASLQRAIDSIAREVDSARERAEEAQAESEAIQTAAPGRIEEIRAKIAVLDPEASQEATVVETDDATEASASDEPAPKPAGRKPARKEAADS